MINTCSAISINGWYAHPEARNRRSTSAPPNTHVFPANALAFPANALAFPANALAFHASLPGYIPTSLTELPDLAEELGLGRVFVKDESTRLGLPAFKVLGVSWAIAQLLAAHANLDGPLSLQALREAAVRHPVELVAATDGNHGQALARMARLVGLRAHVFVPEVISADAAAAIAAEGAIVTTVAASYDQTVRHASAYTGTDEGRILVQDTAWPGYEKVPAWIVEGYDTMLVEVDEQLREADCAGPDLISVPVGVGSLAQAVVAHYRNRPSSRGTDETTSVLSVEPHIAACVLASLDAGELRSVITANTVMAGLNCGTPSSLGWPVLHAGLDAAISVADSAALRAVADLGALGVSSGPSGAASLAGVRAALTGTGAATRREALGVTPSSVVVLLSTEGRPPAAVARIPELRP